MVGHMDAGQPLAQFLTQESDRAAARIVEALADAAASLATHIRGAMLAGGDAEQPVASARHLFSKAALDGGVRALAMRGVTAPVVPDPAGELILVLDALDGDADLDANVAAATLFSVYDAPEEGTGTAAFLQPGHRQRAAGLVIYGPQTLLLFACGAAVHLAALDAGSGAFAVVRTGLTIPGNVPEFAINSASYRHWSQPLRTFHDDCIEGAEGPRGRNSAIRWMNSLAGDAFRVFQRGGLYLCPADDRTGHERGGISLVFQANPLAFLAERAGGAASDGVNRILDIPPASLEGCVALIFGSPDKVELIRRYHSGVAYPVAQSPLFGKRGLLRN